MSVEMVFKKTFSALSLLTSCIIIGFTCYKLDENLRKCCYTPTTNHLKIKNGLDLSNKHKQTVGGQSINRK